MITKTRAANLQDMVEILSDQRAHRHDIVVSADKVRFREGQLELVGQPPMLADDGFWPVDGLYQPTEVFDADMASWLDVPPNLIRKLRSGGPDFGPPRLDLYDNLLNGLLAGRKAKMRPPTPMLPEGEVLREAIPGNSKLSLLRLFCSADGLQNIARTRKSNRFTALDNLDALMAMLAGITQAGIDPATLRITGDLSETKMFIKVHAPEISMLAPDLLAGYVSPFNDPGVEAQREIAQRLEDGRRHSEGTLPRDYHIERGKEPIVHAGFLLSNSEVGQGKYTISQQTVVLACTNGMTRTKDAMERTHLGASLGEGAVQWSNATMQANIDLIQSMASDAVTTFLSKEYLATAVADLTAIAGKQLVGNPREVLEPLLKHKTIAFDDTAIAGILDHFLMGRQRTSGGLAQAITSYSQTVPSADEAHALDAKAITAMELAFAKL